MLSTKYPSFEFIHPDVTIDMWLSCLQGKGQSRPTPSLNTASPRIAQELQESKLTCNHHFICCIACVVCDERECDSESAIPDSVFVVQALGVSEVKHNATCTCGHVLWA